MIKKKLFKKNKKKEIKYGGGGGGGGGGEQDHVSWKINWSFHDSCEIKSAFHVSRKKRHFLT